MAEVVEAQAHGDDVGPAQERPSASPVEALARRDFSGFRADEIEEIADAILMVARKLANQESRRYGSARRGRIIDQRRSVRGCPLSDIAQACMGTRRTGVSGVPDILGLLPETELFGGGDHLERES